MAENDHHHHHHHHKGSHRSSLAHQPKFYSDFIRGSLDHHGNRPKVRNRNGGGFLSKIFCCGYSREEEPETREAVEEGLEMPTVSEQPEATKEPAE